MPTVIGIAGALRRGSYNAALLRAAVELAPAGLTIEVASIREIPLYDGDLEAEHGIPEPVRALKDRIAAADGLLLVTPEYNNSIPGVFKNAIDWLSRPATDIQRVFSGKPVGLMGATLGQGGPRSRTARGCRCSAPSARTPGSGLGSTSRTPRRSSTRTVASSTRPSGRRSRSTSTRSRDSSRAPAPPEPAGALRPPSRRPRPACPPTARA